MKKFNLTIPVDGSADTLELLGEAVEVEGGGTELARLFAAAKEPLLQQVAGYWSGLNLVTGKSVPPCPVRLMVRTLCWGLHLFELQFSNDGLGRSEFDTLSSRLYLLDRGEIEGGDSIEIHEPELVGIYHDNGRVVQVQLKNPNFKWDSRAGSDFRGEVRLVEIYLRGMNGPSHASVRILTANGEQRPPITGGQVILRQRITFRDFRSYFSAQISIEIEKQLWKRRQLASKWQRFVAENPAASLSAITSTWEELAQ